MSDRPADSLDLGLIEAQDKPALDRRRGLLAGPILPTLFGLTLPVIAVVAAQTFVAALEAFWVSKLGTEAVAGVSLVIPLYVLMNTMSNGGIGGGVSSAISRAIGAGRGRDADGLLFHSILIALVFGAGFNAAFVAFGPRIFSALGGAGTPLGYAMTYAAWVFGGAPLIWVVNLTASAMRGAGEVKLPATVSLIGAILLIPLSPALIFGIGPLPRLGVGGAGAATLIFYAGAALVYLLHLGRGRGTLRLGFSGLKFHLFGDILGVGLISAVGTLVASLTVVGVTGAVGRSGAEALAGFGIASRVDSLLVPLLFGLGSGVVTLVGVAVGAGDQPRALKVAKISSLMAFAATEVVGLLLAFARQLWMSLFSVDPAVLADGALYLRIAAPFYGFFGVGLMLYFVSQGRSNMLWPFIAGGLRFAVTVSGAWWFATRGAPLWVVFAFVALGSVLFGDVNLIGFLSTSRARVRVPAFAD